MKLIGIAGGSGSGKSTVSYKLLDSYPNLFEVVNLDDYQKLETESDLPMHKGKVNWDHPDVINWSRLVANVKQLQSGKSIDIDVWSHRSNPNYYKHGKMTKRTVRPMPVVIIEGYLALYNEELTGLYSKKYYLELDDSTRSLRRGKNRIIKDPNYEKEVLIPMHKKFVEPTKNYADKVIDVSGLSIDQVSSIIFKDIESLV